MKKRLLMISSTWDTSFIVTLIHGMKRRLQSEDAELYILNAYDEALITEKIEMERLIYSLPDINQFDGILLAANSVGNQSTVAGLAKYYQDAGLPVLSLDVRMDDVPFIGTDNYQAIYQMTQHMIQVHNCKVFNYIGGPVDHIENQERFHGFCDCLRDHGIEPDSQRILHLAFLEADGHDAYRLFREKGLHLPDAVISANDNMALGYCCEVFADGYQIPEDVKITGFDNNNEGKTYSPSITSVNRKWEELGYSSISQILDMINGIHDTYYFPGHAIEFNESCGCQLKKPDLRHNLREAYLQKLHEQRMRSLERQIRQLVGRSSDGDDFQTRLQLCQEIAGISNLAICLNAWLFDETSEARKDYDDEFIVYMGQEQSRLKRKDGLIPSTFNGSEKIYFLAPLHFATVNFGYCVVQITDTWNPDLDHRTLIESICLGLEGVRQNEALNRINSRLRALYVNDALTGMYNRFGYENFAKSLYEQNHGRVYAIYFDLDNLKTVNDLYGHSVGDDVIVGFANAISDVFRDKSIKVRMGGDEFLIIGEYDKKEPVLALETDLRECLTCYSKEHHLPDVVSVSYGHVFNDDGLYTLEEMIQIADQNMYKQKQTKKRGNR